MRILEMHLHEARLHFYSFAELGRPPRFYFMPTQTPHRAQHGARRFRTLISVAACQAIPAGDGYELRVQPCQSMASSISLDELVYRAFSLLVEEVERAGFAAALRSRSASPSAPACVAAAS